MKIILLLIGICVVNATADAQNSLLSSVLVKNNTSASMDPKKNISGNITAFDQAKLFSRSLNVCGLIQTFDNPGPITLFLPTDSVFNRLSKGKQDSLLAPDSKYNLIAFITYHALPGNVSLKNITKEIGRNKGQAVFRTISGAPLKARLDEYGNIVLIDETGGKSTLQKSPVKQKNGLIYFISAPLVPKFKSI